MTAAPGTTILVHVEDVREVSLIFEAHGLWCTFDEYQMSNFDI